MTLYGTSGRRTRSCSRSSSAASSAGPDRLQREVEERTADPAERLLAIFDVFDAWFAAAEFEGCSFINVLLEIADPASDPHRASTDHLARIRDFVEGLAADAGVADPEAPARQWRHPDEGLDRLGRRGRPLAARRRPGADEARSC